MENNTMKTIPTETALKMLASGLSVLPAIRSMKRPRVQQWTIYQNRLPSEDEVKQFFGKTAYAVCIVCGAVSGNLEIIDFDNHGELFPKWKSAIPSGLLDRLAIEQSQSGGYHVAYRCEKAVCGNLKLAQRKVDSQTVTLIETRGEHGIILCAPTTGYEMIQGDYTALPVLTENERETLLRAAWELNEPAREQTQPEQDRHDIPVNCRMYEIPAQDTAFVERPGDDFNTRGDIRGLLIAHGWTPTATKSDGNEYWRRPGKKDGGCSATLKNGCFYVFSSNAAPFEPEQGYNPFSVYALLEHNGDFTAAAKTLIENGYGKRADVLPNIENIVRKLTKAPDAKEDKDFYTSRELMHDFSEMKQPLIAGLLRRGEVMNIIAAPKTGKSWLVMQLAFSLTFGLDWLGFKCCPCRVLLIDNELHAETLASRMRRVAGAMGISPDDPRLDAFCAEPQRGHGLNIDALKMNCMKYKDEHFDLIIVDAMYKAYPPKIDENSNADITSLYNRIDNWATEMGAAIILVHHTSKGNQALKSVTDVGSGAGAQSRAPDTHLVLRKNKKEGVVSVDVCVRSFPPVMPFCVAKDDNNLWFRDDTGEPGELEGMVSFGTDSAITAKRQTSVSDVERKIILNIGEFTFPMKKTEFVLYAKETVEASKEKVVAATDRLVEKGIFNEKKRSSDNPSAKFISLSEDWQNIATSNGYYF